MSSEKYFDVNLKKFGNIFHGQDDSVKGLTTYPSHSAFSEFDNK